MQAIVWTKYGPPEGLQLREVEQPAPGDDELLIKVRATTVTAGDCEMRRLALPLGLSLPIRLYAGLLRPKRIPILGQELAGEVVAAGKDVARFKEGDQVFGTTGFGFGAYAEYICLPEEASGLRGPLAHKPENISFAAAAAVPTAGFEALHFLREADVGPGKKVLVIGAGGSIGTATVQFAHHFGAEVTGVDHTDKLAMVRAIGAHHVIDYTERDYTRSDERYDLIVDVVGRRGVARRAKLLAPGGSYFLAYAGLSHLVLARWWSLTGDGQLKIESASQSKEDLLLLKELAEAGVLQPVIDRTYPLAQTAEAHRYAESGRKQGNIAITVT